MTAEAVAITEELEQSLHWLVEQRDYDTGLWPEDDEGRLALWLNLKAAQDCVNFLVKEVTADIAENHISGDRIEHEGTVAEVRWSSRRVKWKQQELRSDIRKYLLFDAETGEVRTGEQVLDMREALHPLNGSLRVKTLREEYGFDTDEYCESSRVPNLSVLT